MSIEYEMKDLGYKRTPTDAMMRVSMADGSKYDVPVQAIVDSRDEYYRGDTEDTIGFIRSGDLDDYEIKDWAANNMNWDEVDMYAIKVDTPKPSVDFQDGWTNGKNKIVGKI